VPTFIDLLMNTLFFQRNVSDLHCQESLMLLIF